MKSWFIILGLLPFFSNCTQSAPKASKKNSAKNLSSLAQDQTQTDIGDESTSSDATSTPTVKDPQTASGRVDAKITMTVSDLISDTEVVFPTLKLTKTTADYFQVLRCAASYDMQTLQGESVRKTKSTLSADDLKWAWSQAVNDSHNCKIVAEYIISPTYLDMPAPSGNFYYIANPCISAANSTTGQDGCSFNLSFTDLMLDYENAFMDKMRDKAIELALNQSVLNSHLDEVGIVARKLETRLHLCEEFYAFKETEKAIRRGLIMLGLNIAGAIVGAVVGKFVKPLGMGGGAMMIGMFAQMMGSQIINDILNLNPKANSCLYGEDIAQGLSSQKEIDRARVSARDFETKFKTKETLDRLLTLTKPPNQQDPVGGIIAQDIARMQKVIADMNAIDQKVISVNSFIAAGNKYVEDQMSQYNSDSELSPMSP
jgi:hypothetical protein